VVPLGHHATGNLEIYVLIRCSKLLKHPVYQVRPIATRKGVRQTNRREAAVETVEMLGQAQGATAIGGDDLVDTVSEQESPVQHRDPRLLQREDLPV
jgi:hypothetical protein